VRQSNAPPVHRRGKGGKGTGHHRDPEHVRRERHRRDDEPAGANRDECAVTGVRGILRARGLREAVGIALSPDSRADLAGLFDGSSDFAVPGPVLEAVQAEEADDDQAQGQLDF
jgi:hypothetical protein